MPKIKLGKYEHYRGKRYEVIGIARNGETLEEIVIYRALYDSKELGDNALWARPKKIFLEELIVNEKEFQGLSS